MSAKYTFFNIIFITLIFVIVDIIRRKITVDCPVKKIKKALEKVTNGDYSVRLDTSEVQMNFSDLKRNAYMLRGSDAKRGYMRWWHSFQGVCPTTQETRTFFVEYSILNPALGAAQPILGQHPYYRRHGMKPSYLCIKAGVFPCSKCVKLPAY